MKREKVCLKRPVDLKHMTGARRERMQENAFEVTLCDGQPGGQQQQHGPHYQKRPAQPPVPSSKR